MFNDLRIDINYIGEYVVTDGNYDCDCDEDGFFPCGSPAGTGRTPLDAIIDYLDQLEG